MNIDLRDWFAGQALISISKHCVGVDTKVLKINMEIYGCNTVENFVAKLSYSYADAMLAEREKRS